MNGARVTVPATSANLGPGFDSLAVALSLHNVVEFHLEGKATVVRSQGEGAASLPRDSENLIARAFTVGYQHLGQDPPPVRIEADNQIPLGSGLGSSAAAVVAGLQAASALGDGRLPPAELLELAHRLEGHADNAAAALHGGLCLVNRQGGSFQVHQLPVHPLRFVLVVPRLDLPTEKMREVLPQRVPLGAAAANAAHLGLLLRGFAEGDFDRMAAGARDLLHEPHRLPLIPGAAEAKGAGLAAGARAVVLSGAGPSLLAISARHHQAIGRAMQDAFRAAGHEARAYVLEVEEQGAQTIALEA